MLGVGRCYHMVDVLAGLDREVALWRRALDGAAPWDEIFDGYDATIDWPGGFFYRELIEVYPDAKVLLSVREPEEWERSIRETVWEVRNGDSVLRSLSDAHAHINPLWQGFVEMLDRLLWVGEGTFAAQHEKPEQLIDGMRRYNEEVQRYVPPERLLVWSVSDGWAPLCEFLEVAVPRGELPHLNDRQEFADRVIDASLANLQRWRTEQRSQAAAED